MKQKAPFDQLVEQLDRYPSLDKLHVQRNLALGAAAASLILLVQLLGIRSFDTPLLVALYSTAISIPAWVALAGVVEYYILLGPKSYAHRRSKFANAVAGILFLSGGCSLVAAIGGALYHLEPHAAYTFGAAILTVTLISLVFHSHLARWYNAKSDSSGGA